jgi:hypothetical protein
MTDFCIKPDRSLPKFAAALTAAAIVLAASAAVRAAELEPGQWTGTITPPQGSAAPAEFTVSETGDQVEISVSVMGMVLPFRDIEIGDDSLVFTWTPGPDVRCELDLQDDKSYTGACTDTEGGIGHITMMPPE